MPQVQEPPSTPAFRQTWETSNVPSRERFSYFREAVCEASLALSVENPQSNAIKARIDVAEVPNGIINRIDISPLRVTRTNADLAKIPDEFLALTCQLKGSSTRFLHGERFVDERGDINLISCNEPIEVEALGDGWSAINVILKRSMITDHVEFENIVRFGAPALPVIKGFLQFMNAEYETATQTELSHLFDALTSVLIANLLRDKAYLEDRCSKDQSASSGLLQAIKDHVGRTIADPKLSTLSVADHFNISSRYVQKLFAADNSTFKSHVTNLRLDQIQTDLLDHSMAHVAASDVAFRWGFRDMTTFHRNFKHRFGDTPAQVRALLRTRTHSAMPRSSVAASPNRWVPGLL